MKDEADLTSLLKKTKSKRINSKSKGGRFERKISDMLNERFNTKDFCRTPGSGAFATTHKLPEHLKIYGDLITPKDFNFTIECKSGYNKESLDCLFNESSDFRKMIQQAVTDATKSKKNCMLIIGQDRRIPIAITGKKPENASKCSITFNLEESVFYMIPLQELLKESDSYFIKSL